MFDDFDVKIIDLLINQSINKDCTCSWAFTYILFTTSCVNPIFKQLVKESITDLKLLEITKFMSHNTDFTAIKYWIDIVTLLGIANFEMFKHFPFGDFSLNYIKQVKLLSGKVSNLFKFQLKCDELLLNLDLIYLQVSLDGAGIIWLMVNCEPKSIFLRNFGCKMAAKTTTNKVFEIRFDGNDVYNLWNVKEGNEICELNLILKFIDSDEIEVWNRLCQTSSQKQISQSLSPREKVHME